MTHKTLLSINLIILIFIFSSKSEAISKISKDDSTLQNIPISYISFKDSLEFFKDSYNSKIDSLKSEILKLQIKQGFFGNELDEQTARFSIIIAGILTIIGLFTYGGFKIEIKRLENKSKQIILKQTSEFEKLKNRIFEHERKMNKMYSEFFFSSMERYSNEKNYFDAFWFALYAARESISGIPLLNEDRKIEGATKFTINILKNALNFLNNLLKDISFHEQMRNDSSSFFEMLNSINKSENQTILNYVAEIRVILNKFISDECKSK